MPEIQIFDLILKGSALDETVLHAIDRAVPYPVIHRLRAPGALAFSAAFKRPSEADSSQWVVGARFTSPFAPPPDAFPPLPAVLDLERLYAALLAPLLPLRPRPREPIPAQIDRCERHRQLSRQADQIRTKVRREKQFNRRVDWNTQLNAIRRELAALEANPA